MVAAFGACMVLGCLPAGEPPAGQQLVRDRTLTDAFFSPSESDAAPSSLFCTGPYRTVEGAAAYSGSSYAVNDLYAVPYGKDAGVVTSLASLQPAVDDLAPLSYTVTARAPATDSLGRLFLATLAGQNSPSSPLQGPAYQLTRYDPRTGAVEPLMSGSYLRFSPSRARVFVGDASAGTLTGTLLENQASRSLTGVRDPAFVGEDFYYVAVPPSDTPFAPPTISTVTRIKPNAEPEAILSSSGFLDSTVIQGDQAHGLLVFQGGAVNPLPGLFMLDVDTLATTPLPAGLENLSFSSASPSGRWLLFLGTTPPTSPLGALSQTMTLVDWTTATRTDLDPAVLGTSPSAEWRPGHDELWVQSEKGAFKITEPGDLVTAVAMGPGLALCPLQQEGTDWFSVFTRDGLHWFANNSNFDGRVYVGRADDPAPPALQINPEGTWTKPYWDIGDGRLLVGAWADKQSRQELYLVDLAAGTSQALAGGGQVVAVGRTRALALLEWDGARDVGTLTLVDLATGAKILLAEDVYRAAVDPGRSADVPLGTDALAPGIQVAFLSRGRLASPYDGLWVTELP